MSVGREGESDRVGSSPCTKPLAVEGYLSQQMPGRDRCFSSSMRQIPRARSILYLYSCLFIPGLGASQLHANTTGGPSPRCAFVAPVRGTGLPRGNGAAWSGIWASGSAHRKRCRRGRLPVWDRVWLLLCGWWFHSDAPIPAWVREESVYSSPRIINSPEDDTRINNHNN